MLLRAIAKPHLLSRVVEDGLERTRSWPTKLLSCLPLWLVLDKPQINKHLRQRLAEPK